MLNISKIADFSVQNTKKMTYIKIKIFPSNILTNNLYAFVSI